ncbi:aspartate/glutamate racemase family protein [Teichococcus oryzae]|uniref:Asp/Glu racemase n=1 Tax=Teichococcus oryzae TaxID=1608942 RepID=A0A5B2TDF9_9PROT|nr:aspartate/glutamate racemase family protein [Pseudoroseomonas oryzae]KAA2211898.1 Asp/Glu racemase [Pseudoroseomonas oryzae]
MSRRILVINPNTSASCTRGIADSLRPFAMPGAPPFEVVSLPGGPPAIMSWRDWYSVAEPLCRLVEAEAAEAYIIACVSDPGLEAVRTVTPKPVFGPFRSAVAAALARAERFGVIAFVDASKARQRRALQAMGAEARLAATVALNLPMETLTDPLAARGALCGAARQLVADGAEAVVLGCAGMAGHRAAVEDAAGVPVIEPCQAAAVQAILATGAG